MKMRWGILRSPSWYSINTVNKIIMACCLITTTSGRRYSLDTTPEWTTLLDNMAVNMFNEWRNNAADADRLKFVRGRRLWSKIEEDALILCLTDVVHAGWTSENGFKAGFQ
ncbi:hypothetical protein ACS0TY_012968 [Phlomoides rotata]